MRERADRVQAVAAGLFASGLAAALLAPRGREAALYGAQALLTVIGLARLPKTRWKNKALWAGYLGCIGLGDLAYWFFHYSPWAYVKTPALSFFTGMVWYLAGAASGMAFLLLSGRARAGRGARARLLEQLPALLILAVSCKFVLIPMLRKMIGDGLSFTLFSTGSATVLALLSVIVSVRVLLIEEDLRLASCAMGPLIQALVGWGINIEYLVAGSYQFNYFDHLWFASVFLSVLPVLRWPEEPRTAPADASGEELGYQVRYWLLLLVLVPLTALAFLRAFDPKAASVVSMTILGGVVFSWIASRVLMDRIRSSAELKTLSATAQFASQVAHDIRSPLAALEAVMAGAQSLPEDEKALMRLAVARVRDIADGMLKKNREALERTRELDSRSRDEFLPSDEPLEKACLRKALLAMLAEKRREFGGLSGVRFQEKFARDGAPVLVEVQRRELERLLSNLLNNAVEAFPSQAGTVEVELSLRDGGAVVEIKDDGKGIAAEDLRTLGRRGATFGKTGGSGLGLFHAAQTMRSWGGRLDVESQVGAGTTVRLVFRGT